MKFELLVATRYLKAKRKQAVISLITIISVVGVAAGVAALIVALAINAGFTEDLQTRLLGAQAHLSLITRDATGIADYRNLSTQVEQVEGVVAAAPSIYHKVLISSGKAADGVQVKGIIPEMESKISALSQDIVEGSLDDFGDDSIIIGLELSKALGSFVGDRLELTSPDSQTTPFGFLPRRNNFRVTAIFSSGLYDLDSKWVYIAMGPAQQLMGIQDVVNVVEVKVSDIYSARTVGQRIVDKLGGNLEFQDWMMMNRPIFEALQLERLVMFITIGLIVLVAALNIVATLIMMVLEKTRDIAILVSMGTTQEQIRRVFILQGVIIGVIGTAIGVVLGHVISYVADKYKLISLAPDVYSIPYVPFRAELLDTLIVAAAAILISFLATLYPSAAASRLHPVEALRYE